MGTKTSQDSEACAGIIMGFFVFYMFIVGPLLTFIAVGSAYTVEFVNDKEKYDSYDEYFCKPISTNFFNSTCSYTCYCNINGCNPCYYPCLMGSWIVEISLSGNFNNDSFSINIINSTGTNNITNLINLINQHPINSTSVCWKSNGLVLWDHPNMPTDARDVTIVMWVLTFVFSILLCTLIIFTICIIILWIKKQRKENKEEEFDEEIIEAEKSIDSGMDEMDELQ